MTRQDEAPLLRSQTSDGAEILSPRAQMLPNFFLGFPTGTKKTMCYFFLLIVQVEPLVTQQCKPDVTTGYILDFDITQL